MPESGKIPVTIITGFLGSGKTTLVNYVLKARGERSIAVIENEFGEVNIDRELVSENLIAKEDLVSLENGCVCCSLRRDIVRALAEIGRRDKYRAKPVEAVLLETTGLADPAPVAFTFFANPWIAARFKLDSIVCVVDARHLLQHLEDVRLDQAVNEAAQQIAFADLILLNKTDLASAEDINGVLAAIRSINTTASIMHCQLNRPDGRPPLSQLLDTNSFSIAKARAVDPTFLDSDSEPEEESDADDDEDMESHSHSHSPSSHIHSLALGKRLSLVTEPCEDNCQQCQELPSLGHGERFPKRRHKKIHDLSGVGSVGIVAKGPLDEYRFNMFMRDLLAEKAKEIFRCKGVLLVHGHGNTKFVFQGVHETINYGPADLPWSDEEPKLNRLVFIGRKLDRKAMLEGFRSCVWVPLPEGWEEFRDPQTQRPFYYNLTTKERTWIRPEGACARVVATQVVLTSQPKGMLPRKTGLATTSSWCSQAGTQMLATSC